MHATRAAVEEGIVPGGGVALARSVAALDKLKVDGGEQIGGGPPFRALCGGWGFSQTRSE